MTQPQLEGNAILSGIINTNLSDRRSELVLRRFENEARKLCGLGRENAYLGWTVRGIASCMRGEIEEMHHNHQTATKLFLGRGSGHINYSLSLAHCGLIEEAEAEMAKISDKKDCEYLSAMFDLQCLSGTYVNARDILEQLHDKYPNVEISATSKQILEFLEDHDEIDGTTGKSGYRIAESAAYDYLREHGFNYFDTSISPMFDEESEWLDCEINVDLSPEKVVEHDLGIARRIDALEIPLYSKGLLTIRVSNGV